MDLFDRIYSMHRILSNARYAVSRSDLQERLECSRATVNRIIRDMRNYFYAPIEFDREKSGYFYAKTGEHPFELPGLWFNASELYALLTVQRLLTEVQPGLQGRMAELLSRVTVSVILDPAAPLLGAAHYAAGGGLLYIP